MTHKNLRGTGTMGVVYETLYKDIKFAVKAVKNYSNLTKPLIKEYTDYEIELLYKLRNVEFIVPLLTNFEEEGVMYLVMPFI